MSAATIGTMHQRDQHGCQAKQDQQEQRDDRAGAEQGEHQRRAIGVRGASCGGPPRCARRAQAEVLTRVLARPTA